MIKQSIALQDKQIQLFGSPKDSSLLEFSMGDFYTKLTDEQKQKDLFQSAQLPEKYNVMMAIRAYAKQGNWDKVRSYINTSNKNPPYSFQFLVDLCMSEGKKSHAIEAA